MQLWDILCELFLFLFFFLLLLSFLFPLPCCSFVALVASNVLVVSIVLVVPIVLVLVCGDKVHHCPHTFVCVGVCLCTNLQQSLQILLEKPCLDAHVS